MGVVKLRIWLRANGTVPPYLGYYSRARLYEWVESVINTRHSRLTGA